MDRKYSPHNVVLLTSQRSGSTWLASLLGSHPQVEDWGEMLLSRLITPKRVCPEARPGRAPKWWPFWSRRRRWWRYCARPCYLFGYLDRVWIHKREKPAGEEKRLLLKLMYDHVTVSYPEMLGYFLIRPVCFIHLIRRNILNIILSVEARNRRGLAHSAQPVEQVSVYLPPRQLIRRLRRHRARVRLAKALLKLVGKPCITVEYEKLVEDPTQLQKILDFLELEGDWQELKTSLKKLNRTPHPQLIENYEEVRQALQKTPYAWMLDPPDYSENK